jgi:hypothetical protein
LLDLFVDVQADKEELGSMLLNNVCKSNRKLIALILRVERREFFQTSLALIDSWIQEIENMGEAFIPFDSPFHITESSDA